MDPEAITNRIKAWARDLGFEACGIAPARSIERADYFQRWLAAGRAGSMGYLHRNFEKRVDPAQLLPNARSVIVAALGYHQTPPPDWHTVDESQSPRGRVARYAWGDDYHDVIKNKLFKLVDLLREYITTPFEAKVCVDTAPVLERELAALAGIGWIGKNTMVLNHDLGSYFFLGEIVTTLELIADEPVEDHCGSCRACLDACPTQAFPAAYEMDASRCISYLTIEHRDDIPLALRPAIGDWIFGCDICQEVCPFNRKAPIMNEPRFALRPGSARPKLRDVLVWSKQDYREAVRGSAMTRAKFEMLQRNAQIAAENASTGRSGPHVH
jgi:epoxyqueuosine reductase